MKRVLFPHTSIAPAMAAALHAGLGPVTLFHPLAEAAGQLAALMQTQQIELVYPCPDDADMLLAAYEGFKRWASEHAGQDLAGLMRQGPAIPFFETDATARIAAEIRSAGVAPAEATAKDHLYRARLLLLMAQELDASRQELEADFQRLAAQESRMLAMLKGETAVVDDAALGEAGASMAPAGRIPLHMPTERIAAWAQLALQAKAFWRADSEIIFLTESMDVLAHIREQVEAESLLNEHIVAPGSDELCAWLVDPHDPPPMTAASTVDSTTVSIGLTVCRLPGLETREWLRQLAGDVAAAPGELSPRSPTKGILVGHVERV
jgi:hypothetical protein